MPTPPRMSTDGAQPITNDGTTPMAATLSMGGNRIERLGAPVRPDDAARLADVGGDGGLASGVSYDDSLAPAFGGTNVQDALDAAKTLIATASSDVATAQGDISTLQGDVATAQGDISTLQGTVGAIPTLAAGTYAPTITPITPGTLAAVATANFNYIRVGSQVFVNGSLSVTPASLAGDNQIDISLPVATASLAGLCGRANGSTLSLGNTDVMITAGTVFASGSNARAYFSLAFGNAPSPLRVTVDFSYTVS